MIACLLIENLKTQLKKIQEILTEEAGCLRCEIKNNCIYLNLGVSEITDEADDFIRHLRGELKGICPDIRVGVASSRFASLAAAQNATPDAACVVSSEETPAFMANQSVSLLPLDAELHRRLDRLGLCMLGQLANIKKADLIRQFGKQGATMSELGKGVDPSPLTFYRPPMTADTTAQHLTIWEEELSGYSERISVTSKKIGCIDFPERMRHDDKWLYFDGIIDVWKLEDAWWTEKPQELIYFKLNISGRELTVCHDLVRDDWRLCR